MIKQAIRALLRRAGYELRRISSPATSAPALEPGSDAWWQQTQRGDNRAWLEHLRCRTVVDIGASVGDFSATALSLFPDAVVHAFEPLADSYAQLAQRFAGNPRVKSYPVALGAASGARPLFRNAFAPSSSLLPMAATHVRNFPFTADARPEQVRIERLDEALPAEDVAEPLCIKLDVQGYEGAVIDGGERIFARAAVLIVEMSMEELYEGQPLFDALYRRLHALGFDYAGNLAQLLSPEDGRVLQVDAIFRRRAGA